MRIVPHLVFNGQCAAAFSFYQQLFGGEIQTMLSYADSPLAQTVPPQQQHLIIHATLSWHEHQLLGVDAMPDQYQPPRGFFVLLGGLGGAEARRIFSALSEGGVVQMPLQRTFWSAAFGVLVDRFGIPWEIDAGQ
jgi:PhnB protein